MEIIFTTFETQPREFLACVKSHREDHGVARRANALLLLDDGKSCTQIAEVLYLMTNTVRVWYRQYLSVLPFGGRGQRISSGMNSTFIIFMRCI